MRRLWFSVVLLLILMGVGVIGFRLTTDESWFDCLYLSVITLTTVGSVTVHGPVQLPTLLRQ